VIVRWPFYLLMLAIAAANVAIIVRSRLARRDGKLVVLFPAVVLTALYAASMIGRVVWCWATGVVPAGSGAPLTSIGAIVGNGILCSWLVVSLLLLLEAYHGN
jgi:hypothetical protein